MEKVLNRSELSHQGEGMFTCGEFATEADSVAHLDTLLDETGLFKTYKEVEGIYEFSHHYKKKTSPRIDRIIIPIREPLSRLVGAIGIECKASNLNIGKPFSQCMDYSTAVFRLYGKTVISVKLDFVFLWPLNLPGGVISSIASQNRVGGIYEYDNPGFRSLNFSFGSNTIIRYEFNSRNLKIHDSIQVFGKKKGSR